MPNANTDAPPATPTTIKVTERQSPRKKCVKMNAVNVNPVAVRQSNTNPSDKKDNFGMILEYPYR